VGREEQRAVCKKKNIFWLTATSSTSKQTKGYFFTSRKIAERTLKFLLTTKMKVVYFGVSSVAASLVSIQCLIKSCVEVGMAYFSKSADH
jgi:hypothetical protein